MRKYLTMRMNNHILSLCFQIHYFFFASVIMFTDLNPLFGQHLQDGVMVFIQ